MSTFSFDGSPEPAVLNPDDLPEGWRDLVATVPEPAGSRILGSPVRYDCDGTPCQGFLAWDAAAASPRPAVMLVHDWFGVGPGIVARSLMVARLGYVAFAPDVFGADLRPAGPEEARKAAGAFYGDLDLFRRRLAAGLARLAAQPQVDPARIAAAGYCFGGSGALELARSGAALRGAVSIHGRLLVHHPSDAGRIRGRVLILSGGDDPAVPDADLLAVVGELRAAGVPWEVAMYGGAPHAYTIAGAPSFRPEADRRSWESLTDFLRAVL